MLNSLVINFAPNPDRSCNIKATLSEMEKDEIWVDVCRNLNTEDYLGDDYCILHNPNPMKDPKEFTDIIEERLKSNHCFYQAVVFPVPFKTNHVDFNQPLNFFRAVFYSCIDIMKGNITNIYLDYATFHGSVRFHTINFSQDATFTFAHFMESASFTGSWFERSDFSHAVFDHKAEFNVGAKFRDEVNFSSVKFQGEVDFNSCTFEKSVRFENSEFSEAHATSFKRSEFQSDVIFDGATINNYIDFEGDSSRRVFSKNASMSMRNTRLEKPEHLTFHTVDLHPNWFVNVDSRKFIFTDVLWKNLYWGKQLKNQNIKRELAALEARGIKDQTKRLFEIAARQLAVNAEENNRYDEAARFRYMAMETRRLEETKRLRISRVLTWLYKWTSGYGESWSWAAFMLICVLFFFGLIYNSPFSTFVREHQEPTIGVADSRDTTYKMNNSEGVVYSLYVATLQRPDPKPADIITKFFVIMETIFAPLQAALLALAIRRKFMR